MVCLTIYRKRIILLDTVVRKGYGLCGSLTSLLREHTSSVAKAMEDGTKATQALWEKRGSKNMCFCETNPN